MIPPFFKDPQAVGLLWGLCAVSALTGLAPALRRKLVHHGERGVRIDWRSASRLAAAAVAWASAAFAGAFAVATLAYALVH
ncbi:MAG: hypothetical protein KatS3mg119_0904 [Rhodothalassiaceae bacterium]|nr:MAG: hypothetical protein KatS3mg119_0904 [Rhodothalassiaceae bacterium]